MKSFCVLLLILQISTGYSENQIIIDTVLERNPLGRLFKNHVEDLNFNVSDGCASDILLLLSEAKGLRLWALKMLDASSKIPSDVLDGYNVDLGAFDECISINENAEQRNILGQYCLVATGPKGNLTKVLEVPNEFLRTPRGICLPNTCSNDDIQQLFHQINISATYMENNCQTQNTLNFDNGSLPIIICFGFMVLLVVTSSAYDFLTETVYKDKSNVLLSAFSVFKNSNKIFKLQKDPNDISCIHGLRVLSMVWIVSLHLYKILLSLPQQNFVDTLKKFKEHQLDFFVEGNRAVDTFLLMSGLVLSYVFLSSDNSKFNLFTFYLHRYLRLTPVLGAVVLFYVGLLQYFGSGPTWLFVSSLLREACVQNWWKTLFYVNNYEVPKCIEVSWYLSAEMQLYILSPILLLLLQKKPKVGLCLTGFLAICVTVTSFTITWANKLINSPVFLLNPDKSYMHTYYFKTYTRTAPWFIGIIAGYLIYKTKQEQTKVSLSSVLVQFLWLVSIAYLLLASFYALENNDEDTLSKLESCFYNSAVRLMWAIAVGWIIFGCYFGYGGPVNKFLSLPVFQIMSRLTFTTYLIHCAVIYILFARLRSPLYVSNMDMFGRFWGILMCSTFAAVVLALMFELPFITIDKVLFGRRKQKSTA